MDSFEAAELFYTQNDKQAGKSKLFHWPVGLFIRTRSVILKCIKNSPPRIKIFGGEFPFLIFGVE